MHIVGDFLHGMNIIDRNRDRIWIARRASKNYQLAKTPRMQRRIQNLVVELDTDQDHGIDPSLACVEKGMACICAIQRVDKKYVPAFAPQDARQSFHHHEFMRIGEIIDQQCHQIGTI
ncbi:hypothetical protein D3C71_1875180 [compost metagenome]